jgi:WD40 repeat protein
MVAVVGFHSPLTLFRLDSSNPIATLPCPCVDMRAIAFSPDLRYLAGGGRNGRIRVWDLKENRSIDLKAHSRRIRAITFTADGHQMISAGEDQQIIVWAPDQSRPMKTLQTQSGDSSAGKILALALVNDHILSAATADNMIQLWDLNSGELVQSLTGHTGSIASLVVENDALVSGSFDTTVRVWKLARPQALAHDEPSNSRLIATGVGN